LIRKLLFAFLVLVVSLPALAGTIAADLTLPVAGRVVLPGHVYTTELTITNHRDRDQYVAIQFYNGRDALVTQVQQLRPKQSVFIDSAHISGIIAAAEGVGALRFVAVTRAATDDRNEIEQYRDPAGQLEVKAFIVNVRGPFGLYGSSRQEVEGIPSSEYRTGEAAFLGVLHQPPTYTNVGITNLDPVETVTFYVQFQYLAPIAVTIPPLGVRQIRITGGRGPGEEGNAGRYVTVTPEWARDGSGRSTEWVAYASTIDGITGDAFSGIRVPRELVTR
jgi:hypothetical protein